MPLSFFLPPSSTDISQAGEEPHGPRLSLQSINEVLPEVEASLRSSFDSSYRVWVSAYRSGLWGPNLSPKGFGTAQVGSLLGMCMGPWL